MKLAVGYSHTFAEGRELDYTVWDLIKNIDSLNGLYIADTNNIGFKNNNATSGEVAAWYDASGSGNYLLPDNVNNLPLYLPADSLFNNKPCVQFSTEGNVRLRFKYPYTVSTVIIVYVADAETSYLIYSPKQTGSDGNPNTLYYDSFVPGSSTLWRNELLDSSAVYNAKSRINGKNVSPTAFVPTGSLRILSVTDFDNEFQALSISGIGGRVGSFGGSAVKNNTVVDSVKGRIAAILTFSDMLSEETLLMIENELAKVYSTYTGPVLNTSLVFKYRVNDSFVYDFSTAVIDEWFSIESYELVEPLDIGLSLTGSTISGVFNAVYNGALKLKVINSGDIEKVFEIPLEITRNDPLVDTLPQQSNLTLALSANNSPVDGSSYGIYTNPQGSIIAWEDARRYSTAKKLLAQNTNYASIVVDFDNQLAASFNNSVDLRLGTPVTGKTFVWVYRQSYYGNRQFLDSFPDIYGDGKLWTVPDINTVHGTTTVTSMISKLNNITVNSFRYKLAIDTIYVITAKVNDNTKSVSYRGFNNFHGELAFFASWATILTDNELLDVTDVLATRYIDSNNPRILNTDLEIKTTSPAIINLNNKVSDLHKLNLSWADLDSNPNISIDSGGILTITSSIDQDVPVRVRVTNSSSLYVDLEFTVRFLLKTNSLYLDLGNILPDIEAFYIYTPDSITTSAGNVIEWRDYRGVNNKLTGVSAELVISDIYDSRLFIDFGPDGGSAMTFDNEVQGKTFIVAYIQDENPAPGYFSIYGQELDNKLINGPVPYIRNNPLNPATIINNKNNVTNSSQYAEDTLNITSALYDTSFPVKYISKDRTFTDRGAKGKIGAIVITKAKLTSNQLIEVNRIMRDYFDSAKAVTLLHFNNNLIDSSVRSKTITGAEVFNTSFKRFGAASYSLVLNNTINPLSIPNETDFAFLNEDFTVSFWFSINKALTSGNDLILFYSDDLILGVRNNLFYISSSLNYNNNFYNEELTTYNTFHHVEVGRKNNTLYLFINGVLKHTSAYNKEFNNSTNEIKIGQSSGLNTESVPINCFIDELLIYRRACLHTSNFTVPTTEYVF